MAVTQINSIETTLKIALDYICNRDKTDEQLLIYGHNCTPEMAAQEFEFTKKNANSTGGRLAYHMIQSFAPGEVDYDTAHELGKRWADEHLKGKYEYVLATHVDLPKTTFIKNKINSTFPCNDVVIFAPCIVRGAIFLPQSKILFKKICQLSYNSVFLFGATAAEA